MSLIDAASIKEIGAAQPTAGTPRLAKVSVSACAKAILVGEHAVVYGARAIAMPVPDLRMQVRLERRLASPNEPLIRASLGGRSVSAHLLGVVEEAFELLSIKPFALDIEGASDVLVGAGLGSSASLCVVILRALAEAAGITLTPQRTAELANRLERRFHGNPSGLDTAVVAFEQVISFRKGETPESVRIDRIKTKDGASKSWSFALVDSGARSSTIAMIERAAPYFSGASGKKKLEQFNEASRLTIDGLYAGNSTFVAEAMKICRHALTEAGVVTPLIEQLMSGAESLGVKAVKPTGAGGGGCILVLLNEESPEDQLFSLRSKFCDRTVLGVKLG